MPDGTIVGIGLDNYLWTRRTLNSQWTQVPTAARHWRCIDLAVTTLVSPRRRGDTSLNHREE